MGPESESDPDLDLEPVDLQRILAVTQRHIVQPAQTPMSNLLLAVLNKLGCQEEHFGDSTERMAI